MSNRLKCVLLDDELLNLSYLKMILDQFPEVEVVKTFNDPQVFLKEIGKIEFDCCFLDIQMPKITGLEVAKELTNKHVVFITAHKEFAADAFDLNALDYIRKPISVERLKQAIEKIKKSDAKKDSSPVIIINSDKGKKLLKTQEIVHIETAPIDSRDKIILLNDGTEVLGKNISFDWLSKQLIEMPFVRVNKKEIISLSFVAHFTLNEITIEWKEKQLIKRVSLSTVYRNEFLNAYGK
jgi:DNA-binding LytR/AlgR family response regulator